MCHKLTGEATCGHGGPRDGDEHPACDKKEQGSLHSSTYCHVPGGMLGICEFLFILTLGLKVKTQGFVSKYKFILYVHTFQDETLKRTVYIQNKQENKLKKHTVIIIIITK